jgi:hypothetical protein
MMVFNMKVVLPVSVSDKFYANNNQSNQVSQFYANNNQSSQVSQMQFN